MRDKWELTEVYHNHNLMASCIRHNMTPLFTSSIEGMTRKTHPSIGPPFWS